MYLDITSNSLGKNPFNNDMFRPVGLGVEGVLGGFLPGGLGGSFGKVASGLLGGSTGGGGGSGIASTLGAGLGSLLGPLGTGLGGVLGGFLGNTFNSSAFDSAKAKPYTINLIKKIYAHTGLDKLSDSTTVPSLQNSVNKALELLSIAERHRRINGQTTGNSETRKGEFLSADMLVAEIKKLKGLINGLVSQGVKSKLSSRTLSSPPYPFTNASSSKIPTLDVPVFALTSFKKKVDVKKAVVGNPNNVDSPGKKDGFSPVLLIVGIVGAVIGLGVWLYNKFKK